MTNFGNFGPILIKFGGEVEFSVTNSIWEYGMPEITFVIFHDEITFERFELVGWNFMCGLIMEIFSKK